MKKILFTSDVHGNITQYKKVFEYAQAGAIKTIIFGGDLSPKNPEYRKPDDQKRFFINDLFPLIKAFDGNTLMIMGNDDYKSNHQFLLDNQHSIGFQMIDNTPFELENGMKIVGYSYVPYTPFQWKDWEKRDLKTDDETSLSPVTQKDGYISIGNDYMVKYSILDTMMQSSIETDLHNTTAQIDGEKLILVAHTPPFNTSLDCALIGESNILHVGSRAVHKFIEEKQPKLTLHGHIHETVHASKEFLINIGKTKSVSVGNEQTSSEPYVLLIDENFDIERICLK